MRYGASAALLLAGLALAAGAQAQLIDDVDVAIDRYDSDDTAWKAIAGWRANPCLALELAYVNLGSPDDEILPDVLVTVDADGFAPYVVGTVREDESGDTFTWSAGLGLDVLERANIRLEYEQFDFDDIDDSSALWLTGAFGF